MKVLISAASCLPGRGSEPGTGWAFARAAALRHDVWLLTRRDGAESIEEECRREPNLRLHPVYIEVPRLLPLAFKNRLTSQIYYIAWQLKAARHARRLRAEVGLDLVHHVTWATDFLPMGVGALRDVPVVLGPIGGSGSIPFAMRRWLGWRGRAKRIVNDAIISVLRRLFVDRTARRAAAVLTVNKETAHRFRRCNNVIVEPNVALLPLQIDTTNPPKRQERVALYAGRVVTWKGILLAVAALAEPAAAGWRLEVLGWGRDVGTVKRLAERYGVRDRVRFHSFLPRAQALQFMRRVHCLLFPSMLDAGPWVVAEAMSLGTPVVGVDLVGVGALARGVGHLVPPDRHAPRRLAEALAAVPLGTRPSNRWDADRIPDFLESVYTEAMRFGSYEARRSRG